MREPAFFPRRMLLHCHSPQLLASCCFDCSRCAKSLSDPLGLRNLVCVFTRELAGELIGGVVGNLSGIVNLDDDEGGFPSSFPPPIFDSPLPPYEAERGGGSQAADDLLPRHDDVRSEWGQGNEDEELQKVCRSTRMLPSHGCGLAFDSDPSCSLQKPHARLTTKIRITNCCHVSKYQALKLSEETAAAEEISRRCAHGALSRGARKARGGGVEPEVRSGGVCSVGSAGEASAAQRGGGVEREPDKENGSSILRDHIDCDALDSSLEEIPVEDEAAKRRGIASVGDDHMEIDDLEGRFFETGPAKKA